ncbi:hypothetical protein MMC11_007455 [Xylographa trunciseda]|nr:hypothetical protein [Xylographa trunciseda]
MSPLKDFPNVTLLTIDVTSPSSVAKAAQRIGARTGGRLDYLVNNAGCLYVMPALDVDVVEAKRLFDVNFWGVLAMVKAFEPLLSEAHGTIVNISSVSGCIPVPWMSVYAASKAALTIASETLRLEMMPLGIRVLTVNAGFVKSNLIQNSSNFHLPQDSKYGVRKEEIAARARMEDVASTETKTEDFARRLVRHIIGNAQGPHDDSKKWKLIAADVQEDIVAPPSYNPEYRGSRPAECSDDCSTRCKAKT